MFKRGRCYGDLNIMIFSLNKFRHCESTMCCQYKSQNCDSIARKGYPHNNRINSCIRNPFYGSLIFIAFSGQHSRIVKLCSKKKKERKQQCDSVIKNKTLDNCEILGRNCICDFIRV